VNKSKIKENKKWKFQALSLGIALLRASKSLALFFPAQ